MEKPRIKFREHGKMIKLAIRITDIGAVVHMGGGDPSIVTHIVTIENEQLERILLPEQYTTKTISVVREENNENKDK